MSKIKQIGVKKMSKDKHVLDLNLEESGLVSNCIMESINKLVGENEELLRWYYKLDDTQVCHSLMDDIQRNREALQDLKNVYKKTIQHTNSLIKQ